MAWSPERRLIGWCGAPRSSSLGAFTGDLDDAARRMREQIDEYPAEQPVVPVVELIATVAQRDAGADGMFRTRRDDGTIGDYLEQANRIGGLLLLNIQPGRAGFLDEARAYDRWLREPNVALALDPEWAIGEGEVPGKTYGQTTGGELDQVARYLADIVETHGLPPKPMVYHQVASSVVVDQHALLPHPGVTPILSVDGLGTPDLKRETWRVLMGAKPDHVKAGFKLFYDEDTKHGSRLLSPTEVMALTPRPDYVLYE